MSPTLERTTFARHTSLRVAGVVISALMALLASALVWAPAAQAAPVAIDSSSLHWGIKSSWRSYITNIALGTATASDGATKDTNSGSSPYTWEGAGGTYDTATQTGHLDFSGKVVFSAPAHTIWNITIANPSIVFDGSSTGTIVADVSYSTGGTSSAPADQGSDTDVEFGTFTASAPTVDGSALSFTGPAGALTAAGAAGFGGFYEAGAPIDGFTATANDGPAAPVVSITTSALPEALAGKSYRAALAATGGKKSYKWAVTEGALPTGLKLSSAGRFSGTATNPATANITVQVTDRSKPANVTTREFTLTVAPMTVATTSLPDGTVGKSYSGKLTATGGKSSLKWSVAAGALPTGMKLTSSGRLSGRLTVAGTYDVTLKVTDNTKPTANVATKAFTIVVN